MNRSAPFCPGPLSRRQFLKIGSLTLGGVGLHGLCPWKLSAEGPRSDTSVILVWLPGGPPHMETYDMKPGAPAEYRGAFKPIKTNVPGIDVGELLPLHSKVADKFAIIRSIAHRFPGHPDGHERFLTGYDPSFPLKLSNEHPMVGSIVARMREKRVAGVPNYINIVDTGRDPIDTFNFGAAYLGTSTHPFPVTGEPSEQGYEVKNLAPQPGTADRVSGRAELFHRLDQPLAAADPEGSMVGMGVFQERALQLLMTDTARKAFDLTSETPKLRERYGMHRYGQRALMARRLVEAGASFVTVVMEDPAPNKRPIDAVYNWDSHAVNCHIFNDAKWRFPYYDQAVTALIEDLYARGLDQKVMLIVTGEFGRTPKINYETGTTTTVKQPGRDHWPFAMSVLVSGGGMKMGQIIGSTNARGEHPKERPMTPNDLWATMFRHLGIDHQHTVFYDHLKRPLHILPFGDPIAELL